MRCGLVGLLLLCIFAAAAQPQRDSFQAAYSAYLEAQQAGRFDAATAKREELARMLETAPADSPQLGSWAQMTAQIYESAGMHAQARAITEQALDRVAGLGESSPVRIQLLTALSNSSQQDRNLLKAIAYLEKAAAAAEKAPNAPPGVAGVVMKTSGGFAVGGSYRVNSLGSVYARMANLYRQLGRPDSVNEVLAKLRALGPENQPVMASIYQNEGRWDEAAAIYKNQVKRSAADPMQSAFALQALSNFYQQQERYADAASVLQQAVNNLPAAGMRDPQISAMQRQLARALAQAGQAGAADQLYQQLLANQSNRDNSTLLSYANHLADTNRASQAESLLKGYLDSHSDLQPYENASILFTLSNAARKSGDNARADEYARMATAEQSAASQRNAPSEQSAVQKYIAQAQSTLAKNQEAAFGFALQALDVAAIVGAGREQVVWSIPAIANQLAGREAPEKAEQLYQRLFALVQSWSADTLQPALQVAQSYAQFLISREDRGGEAADAIERYRALLISARGEATGWQEDVLHMRIGLEQNRDATARAVIAGQDLVALQESLNGLTSEPYLRALETLAGVYARAGNTSQELVLRQQAVEVSDLVSTGNDTRRVQTRMDAALLLARVQRFDEAESLAAEALTMAQGMRPARVEQFRFSAEQILRMRKP